MGVALGVSKQNLIHKLIYINKLQRLFGSPRPAEGEFAHDVQRVMFLVRTFPL